MNVIVIGGGAAGMMAALTAAEQGHHVTILERQARVGRKLMATGNGRCNLTNRHASPAHYHGQDANFCAYALEAFNVEATLEWFSSLGLVTITEDSGRVYPYSNLAGIVLDVLRFALEHPNITLVAGCVVTNIRHKNGLFTVTAENDVFTADKVILAAGGAAGSKVGGVMDGYQLGKAMGHHRTALYPSLVQLKTDPTYPRALKGVKAEAAITIRRRNEVLAQGKGEVLFTEYGVSGPAIFELSRAAATGGEGLEVELDFLPDWSEEETLAWVTARQQQRGSQEAGTLLCGTLHSRLGQMLCKAAGYTAQPCDTLDEKALRRIARQLRHFTLPITGVCGFDQAQVTAGGLRTDEFDPTTMESKLVSGFYACGEVLDIDGDCGGYNLQWAWSSGHLAGLLMSNN